ncbi:MAG TPA: sugar phosphate nucleotidyltransferase [Cyclobacteriaceae bacterium]|nr:sugar phosphate nucleotidyltransferase [Cyclobacteriaceae bacterium]
MKNSKNLSLLVMAAGMGSRYGGIKQIDGFGPSGETIMDYSLFDALRSGFTNFVFIVREEIKDTVKEMFLPKLQGKAEVHFEVQSLDRFVPSGLGKVERKKPWGTTHAMLCGKDVIDGPFAVINADDFYGRSSFESLATFFKTAPANHHAMVGYKLEKVLSDHGSVSRGVAEKTDAEGYLLELSELTKIVKEHGRIVSKEEGGDRVLEPSLPVSMNCWGFQPGIFALAEKMFAEFAEKNKDNPSAEFYIALLVTELIRKNLGKVHILPGGVTWFGVTYKEDKDAVSGKIRALVEKGEYPKKLWA